MVFERATPPALRWVVAFLAICGALGLWLGFKDQIRRNPPAWYTGAPDPVTPAARPGDAAVRDATAFDPNAPTQTPPPASTARPEPKAAETRETEDEDGDDAPPAPLIAPPTLPPTTTAPVLQPAQPRPRPAPPPPVARPTPSEDPVGDLLDPPSQNTPPVPY